MITQNKFISQATNVASKNVDAVVKLLNEGATVPFIIRYRHDKIGAELNEKNVLGIRDSLANFIKFEKRFKSIIANLTERKLLSDQLKEKFANCQSLIKLEAIFYPLKESRQTRMAKAVAMGLEPLAAKVMLQEQNFVDFYKMLGHNQYFVDEIDDGIIDIISANLTLNEKIIKELRTFYERGAVLECKLKKNCDQKKAQLYKNYFKFDKKIQNISSHQFLAISRGVDEKILQTKVSIDEERCIKIMRGNVIRNHRACYCKLILVAIDDCFKRYLKPMFERAVLNKSKENADITAIEVFTNNLQQLLLTTPLGEKNVLALDPGFTHGVKFSAVNAVGGVLDYGKIFPFKDAVESQNTIDNVITKHNIEVIALGNGTASHETMQFLKPFCKIPVVIVDECGASIYSVTDCAIEEFPDIDSTIRSAVSIGRRLQNPLAELVKIPVESLGIGQYQHDVDNKLLNKSLDDEVVHCVNKYGINLNLASKELLQYVSGLGMTKAKNIVEYRQKNGNFKSRNELQNIPSFGAKSFEQSSGFLKIVDGNNILDNTSIHPESYPIAQDILQKVKEIGLDNLDLTEYNDKHGKLTIQHIVNEIDLLLNDKQQQFDYAQFDFSNEIESFSDLVVGDKVRGKVLNITNFGAFIDIGIHENGFIHISEVAEGFISDINEHLTINEIITPSIISIDNDRKKFALSLK